MAGIVVENKSTRVKTPTSGEIFANSGASLREQMSKEEQDIEGSMSDKVAFITCLGDPAKPKPKTGPKNVVTTVPEIVGYKFKALADLEYQSYELHSRNPFDVTKGPMVEVKAGEYFDLCIMEVGDLITSIKYAGEFTGEGQRVFIAPAFSKERPKTPLPTLRRESQSIKDDIEEIAYKDSSTGKWVIRDEYADKFGVIYTSQNKHTKSGLPAKERGIHQKEVAAQFRELYATDAYSSLSDSGTDIL